MAISRNVERVLQVDGCTDQFVMTFLRDPKKNGAAWSLRAEFEKAGLFWDPGSPSLAAGGRLACVDCIGRGEAAVASPQFKPSLKVEPR